MKCSEKALTFGCEGDRLVGILHRPKTPIHTGVLIIVGGPQYRVGSHRQFVLLARHLVAAGIPALRFDYRGMGDSDGVQRAFDDIDADVRAAVDTFFELMPEIAKVVIWGLCDAASAALMYAHRDDRINGLILVNPWVRSESTLAKTALKRHYRSRLFDADLWKRLFTGRLNPIAAVSGLLSTLRSATNTDTQSNNAANDEGFVARMRVGLAAFPGRVLFVLSGDDMTAAEFEDEVERTRAWREILERTSIEQVRFQHANHTFSRREWRDQVAKKTEEWVRDL